MAETTGREARTGLWNGFAAYGIWGLFPLFWPLLEPAGAADILANRMTWSLVAVALMLLVQRRWAWIRPLLAQPRRLALSALAAAVISVNWGVYIWGVNSGHVVETSLGYFINPLVTIAFGVLVLRERLRRAQWVAVGIGAAAVAVLSLAYGRLPWIALTLALSFATYGLLKKKIALGGLESLALESAAMFPFAVAYLVYLAATGQGTLGRTVAGEYGWGHSGLLMLSGLITAVPLMCFGAAAVRVPLTTLGLLQYLAPVFQFLIGVAVFHESMPPARWAGFALVWAALAVLTWDALRRVRAERTTAARRTAVADTVPDPAVAAETAS
ncbi:MULTISPECIES: EamA family transporter RarD [Kitasatospora]|uniref:Chloramphenicol-sensitive protein RarD n=2 Tax=Kitasatospora TaxID=2063 RepID=A0ABT1IQ25_9ACTN|nr:EamA family transporter RarD [Kitasatospora paracochleata]MCP2307200.1 chloramphenicol-sensitive protein RarD [Kitasatospora paracochleata]